MKLQYLGFIPAIIFILFILGWDEWEDRFSFSTLLFALVVITVTLLIAIMLISGVLWGLGIVKL